MPMGNVWAWPSQTGRRPTTLAGDGRTRAGGWPTRPTITAECGHPLEITHDLAAVLRSRLAERGRRGARAWPSRCRGWRNWWPPARWKRPSTTPTARRWARTPTTCSGREFVNRDLAAYLTGEFAGEYLDRYTLREPKPSMPLYHLVGGAGSADRRRRRNAVDDGLPETLPEWIAADGLTHLKIKLNGDDLAWDVERVRGRRAGGRRGPGGPRLRRLVLFGRLQREVRQRRVRARLSGPGRRADRPRRSSGCSTSSSRRTATCGPIPKTACTRRPRSSRW